MSYGKLLAYLAARGGDLATAEDALADAFAAALARWPECGVPDQPAAWLLTAARRKLIDAARRSRTARDAEPALLSAASLQDGAPDAVDPAARIPDERLRLLFACAHPAIDPSVHAPLMLQTVLGLDAARIASSLLLAPATLSQRLVRAKRKIRDARIPFRLPEEDELPARLDAVAQAIYAAFTTGLGEPDPHPGGLADEAVWLGRVLAELLPQDAEALGLLALMRFAESRRAAARSSDGTFVPLSAQDPARWDHAAIDEAEALLQRALSHQRLGRFQLEAAIQSAHAARRKTGRTDWQAIVTLYDALAVLTGSIVVAVNRAAADGELRGPAFGLEALDAIADDPRLATYQPYWAARAEFLARIGRRDAASDAYTRAIGLTADPAVRSFLTARRSLVRTA